MKKLISVLLILSLLCPVCGSLAEETEGTKVIPSQWETGTEHELVRKDFPFYVGDLELAWPGDFPLYFADGVDDLPFMDLNDFAAFMNYVWVHKAEDYQITVEANPDTGIVMCTRENGITTVFNFTNSRIVWPDYFGFLRCGSSLDYLGVLDNVSKTDKEGRPYLLTDVSARERKGEPVALDLKEYGIPMLAQDGLYLVPVQTLSAFFLNLQGFGLYFNGQTLIMGLVETMGETTARQAALMSVLAELTKSQASSDSGTDAAQDQATQAAQLAQIMQLVEQKMAEPSLLNTYLAGKKGSRSLPLRDFAIRELAMELDHLYGIRETHDIDSFMMFFLETGLYEALMGEDTAKADLAIRDMVRLWLDDGHSTYYGDSYLLETPTAEVSNGYANTAFQSLLEKLPTLRQQYTSGAGSYHEVGNTAYITLDNFTYTRADYYGDPDSYVTANDTCAQIIEAHRQITRENSPIENVVLDLSCNTGGKPSAAVYLLSWFLGDAQLSVKDSFSGAETTTVYRADINLDRKFDEQDTLAGRGLNLYCLISPVSFSCGNLVPWAFKMAGPVKLLGSKSRGGSCVVLPMTTAWGTSFVVSGPLRISFMINGAYYDVDKGVEPDYVIRTYDHLYDREKLTNYINSLY